MKQKTSSRLLALLLSVMMIIGMLPMTVFAANEEWQLLALENVTVTTTHEDGSQGDTIDLEFDPNSGIFTGKLANYTDLKEYNDADISIVLNGLPDETTAQLKTESGEKISDFVNGTASTTGNTVSKKGSYTFELSLQSGGVTEDYTLKLEKEIGEKWKALSFEGIPAFDQGVTYYGEPEGTLFQLDENGQRTGKTGLSEDCFQYDVYVSAATDAVKPAGSNGPYIFKNSFSYAHNSKASVYIDDEPLFENVPTCLAMAMKWAQLEEGVKLSSNRVVMRIEFKKNEKELITTTINFVVGKMDTDSLIAALEELELETLVWPDDSGNVNRLYQAFSDLSEEEQAKIPQELQEKLTKAYDLMRDDRVPSKLEIVKPAARLIYTSGQTFDPAGMELRATYDDGSIRTITEDFIIEPAGPLTDETEVTITYNTVSVSQPIKLVKLDLEGEGTQDNPYKLTSAADLQDLNDAVAAGSSTEGKYYEMTSDITLPQGWKPMGVTIDGTVDIKKGENLYAFSGIIDGKNHTLTVPEGGLPLLGYVKGAEVRNLNIYGRKIAGYGLVNNLEGVGLSGSSIVIDNVTLKSGSSTLKSGLLGANITTNPFAGCSAAFVATVRNCTIEEDVVIGYEKDQSMIGSIAGRMQGTVENCKSYATVYGTNYVGGIIGTRDNAMGEALVSNCEFGGTINATGDHVGGIIGGAYSNSTAPNGGRITVTDCSSSADITGKNKVGGILGADTYVLQSWGQNTFNQNSFTGTVKATDGEYVGGVIGYLGSLNKYDGFTANYYSSTCGTEKGIGFVRYVDTSCETHETESGATYFNSAVKLPGVDGIVKMDLNRTDDPLGADAEKLCYTDSTPVTATELLVSGTYKTEYIKGDALDLTGIKLTVVYNTGTSESITLKDVAITGFDPQKVGQQEITLDYEGLTATIEVQVRNPAGEIIVTVSILGDSKHNSETDGQVHTLAADNLEPWIEAKEYTVDSNATVLDILTKIFDANGMTYSNPSGNYIESVTYKGVELGALDNGPNSGWMYTLNGEHSDLGVAEQYLENGDVIVFHYTDDYTKESAMGEEIAAEDVVGLIDAIGTVTPDSGDAISAARTAYDSLSAEQKKLVNNYETLVEAEKAYAQLIQENESFKDAYKATGDYLASLGVPGVGSIGGEWIVIGLARSDREVADAYYDAVVAFVREKINNKEQLDPNKSTENSRIILALTALGYDVTDVDGHNLLQGLTDMDYVTAQGVNGPIWALIALDSHDYKIPTAPEGAEQVTHDKLIAYILEKQLDDGGWALSGNTADPDTTAMALQALASYYDSNSEVKAAVDKALECLSKLQQPTGGYASWGTVNAESCAQVVVALTALGINPDSDERFIKNGASVLDALLSFAVDEGGFKHIYSEDRNQMATEQGYYALVAYDRFLNSKTKTSLYDMSDVEIHKNPFVPVPEDKDITLTDVEGTGVTATGKESVLGGLELEAKLLTSGELYDKVKVTLKDGKFTLYDLCLLKNSYEEVQPDGTITIAIPVPDGYDGTQCKLYRVNADGSVTEVTAVLKDGKLTFDTNQIGAFAVYQPVKAGTSEPGTTEPPKTGDSTPVALWFTASLCSLAALAVLGKKKKTVK